LGYSQEELKKMDVGDIHPKTSLEHVVADFDAQARGKKIFESGLPCLKKDGTIIYADIKAAKAIIDGIECNVGFFTDVTERKQAEEKLEIAEQNYRNSLDDSPLGIRIVTADGELLYANKTILDIYGYSSVEEFKAIPRKKLYTPESYSEHQQRKELRKAGKPVPSNYEISIVRKDGGIRQLSVLRKEVTWNGERQFQVIYQDVTEGKKMQEQLIVTDRLASIGELSAGIAHEINNPLTGVIGFSDLLSDRKDLPDDVKEDLKVINREARRTADVVRNLLTFARKHEVQKTPIDINKVIQNVLDLRAYEQKVNNIEVKTSLSPDLSEINADAFRLQQVFLNIVINAEFFMNEAHGRGTLTITTERIKNVIRASISDDGPGIAKVAINHLFDPFFTTKEVGKGTGLGLSICHGIITEHGGRIYAESELDKGATFVIELPIDIK
jgi:PAS domain S-box-containing protein